MRETTKAWRKGGGAVLSLLFLFLAAPGGAPAQAVPEKLEIPRVGGTLSVLLTDEDGVERDLFRSGSPPVFDINFVLAMSAVDDYPVSFILIHEAGDDKEKIEIWEGTLKEGFYRLRYPLPRNPVSAGMVLVRVVMKARIFAKKYSGESSYQYTAWEGSYRVGKR